MKNQVIVDDFAVDEKERLCWVSVIYLIDSHKLFQISFIPYFEGVEVVGKNPPAHIPNDIFLLMRNAAMEEFKKRGIFYSQNQNAVQAELPLK